MDADERRLLVLNPVSGNGNHVDDIVELAGDHGFEVRTTEEHGDARRIAREEAPNGDMVAAAGGDGTLNEVVDGIVAADALETTTVAVVPAGTGNNFATNVGVDGIEHAFDVIEGGRRREIDLGSADGRAFVNSCVGGVTAEASGATTPSEKREFGVLAYVLETFERARSFDPLRLRVDTAPDSDGEHSQTWEGEATFVLVGNCRRFTGTRTAQANVEDGLFEVVIVEDAGAIDLLGDAAFERLFGRDGSSLVRRRTPSLTVESLDDDTVEYSLDGEMLEAGRLTLETEPGALRLAVGDQYRPDPDDRHES